MRSLLHTNAYRLVLYGRQTLWARPTCFRVRKRGFALLRDQGTCAATREGGIMLFILNFWMGAVQIESKVGGVQPNCAKFHLLLF